MALELENYNMALKLGAKLGANGLESGGVASGIFPVAPAVAQDDIAAGAGGAISVLTYFTTISTDAGGDAFTLADGSSVGQVKRILVIVDGGGDAVITPATFAGGTTITCADAGDYCVLIWTSSGWVALELGNTVDGVSAPVVA